MTNSKKPTLKTLKSTDSVSITFGEWFDKQYGNTYYDAVVCINDDAWSIPMQYGYSAGGIRSINEALEDVGYRVRTNKKNPHKPYRSFEIEVITDKKKREMYKGSVTKIA